MADAPKRGNFLRFITLFLVLYLGTQLVFGYLFPKEPATQPVPGAHLTATDDSFTLGHHPILALENRPATSVSKGVGGWVSSKLCSVKNFFTKSSTAGQCAELAATHTGETVTVADRCPQPPVDVFAVENAGTPQEKISAVTSGDTAAPCGAVPSLAPGESTQISMAPWKYSLFEKIGTFEARIPESDAAATHQVTRFSIVEPGVITKMFRTFITAPFLNFLILIASYTPGYNLGVAIIILTLVVKLLLFFPTQHALEGQKKMQMLQPKLNALKEKYKGDAAKIQEETMKLWKEHKINPFSSCLPMLIQFPILIGLFYVIRDGGDLALSRHLIYGFYQNLSWDFGTHFLWLDLLKPDILVMPILLVVLQFLQMKLTFSIQKRKKQQQEGVIDTGASPQDMQQKFMLYGLPVMIGFFAFQFPAAVALYWGVSTLFGIGQQMIVNREHLRV